MAFLWKIYLLVQIPYEEALAIENSQMWSIIQIGGGALVFAARESLFSNRSSLFVIISVITAETYFKCIALEKVPDQSGGFC